MRGWDQLLDGYLAECSSRGLAEATVQKVARELERWGRWMKRCRPRPTLDQIDASLIVRFIRSRSSFRSNSTVYGTLSTMRGMGEYLVRQGVWQSNPTRWMRGPKISPYSRLPKRLGGDELERLWSAAADCQGVYRRSLWVTVLSLLYGTGLRRGELSRLQLEDWDRSEGLLRIDGRKTGWQRQVPVPELTYRCLEAFLPIRQNQLIRSGHPEHAALLIGMDGRPMSAAKLGVGVHRIAARAGVKLGGVHQLRHTCASDLLEAGVALPEVQRILGHQAIETTVRYTHIANPQRSAAIALHPINDWLRAEARP